MKLNKPLMITLFTLILFFMGQAITAAESQSDDMDDAMLEKISLDNVENHWNKLVDEYGGYLPDLQKTGLYEFIKSKGSFSIKKTVIGLIEYLFHELILNGKLLGLLLMLTLFSVVLQTMHTAFERSAVSKIAYFVVYVVLLFIALNSFYVAVSYAKESIDMMSSFMIALLPLVLGLMASFGNIAAVSFFHPIVIFLIHLSGVLISK